MGDQLVWYYTDAAGNPIGPYDVAGLRELASGAHITGGTPIWREGLSEWLPLAQHDDLKEVLQACPAEAMQTSTTGGEHLEHPDDELQAFQAEIASLEEVAAEEAAPAGAPASPEERSFEDDDGTVYEWDSALRKYVASGPAADAAADMSWEDMVYQPETERIPTFEELKAREEAEMAAEAATVLEMQERKRKSTEASTSEAAEGPKEKKPKQVKSMRPAPTAQQPQGWFELKNNTSVYITGLPDDVTVEEVHQVFSKCGIIKEDAGHKPRIKLYRDKQTGVLKGDALISYLKAPSVDLACQLLDDTPFRPGIQNMTVQPAKFEMKGDQYIPKARPADKQKKRVMKQLEDKGLSWAGCDDRLPAEKVTVVLKHAFHPDELIEDPNFATELEEDMMAECSKLGPVEKVRVFRTNAEGVISVRFKTLDGVQPCLQLMNGRWFGGRQLTAELWDGITNYNVKLRETAEEQQARLEAFAKELEGQ